MWRGDQIETKTFNECAHVKPSHWIRRITPKAERHGREHHTLVFHSEKNPQNSEIQFVFRTKIFIYLFFFTSAHVASGVSIAAASQVLEIQARKHSSEQMHIS